jgi:hypothetical protein
MNQNAQGTSSRLPRFKILYFMSFLFPERNTLNVKKANKHEKPNAFCGAFA